MLSRLELFANEKKILNGETLLPRPSTGPKTFWAGPNFFGTRPKIHVHFVPHQKMISIQQIRFLYLKIFEEALNPIKFLDWLKNLYQLKTF